MTAGKGRGAAAGIRAARAVLALPVAWFAAIVALSLSAVLVPAHALTPIVVQQDQDRIEITTLGEIYESRGDTLQIEAAAGETGTTGRMSVRAATPGTNPNWMVFALSNPTDRPIERWLTAERYSLVGSGVIWPDLDARRIEAVTPSVGFVPERIKSDRADIFRITLEPGQTITYVAELSSERFARLYVWKPIDYEVKARDRLLFNGIMLGITGLLATFLTAVFAANHKAIFPAASLVAWCVLAYLCVDFGFFHKLFQLRPDDNAVYRAATESAMAASLVIFLHIFLRLGLSHGLIRMLTTVWIVAQLSLIAVSVVDPRLASTFARGSFALIGGVGGLLTLYLALRGQDRALSLVPTWLLFLVWVFGVGITLTGRLSGDIVVSGLVAGLVMLIVLLGFTVTQFAFRSLEPVYGAAPSELQLRSLAVDGAGASIWEWNARRDEIKVSPEVEAILGLNQGELSVKVDEFAKHLHLADRERFKLMLWSVQERAGGKIRTDFRLRHADNSYRWFELEAATIANPDRRAVRCVGLIRDVTDSKRAYERLLHDAVHCSLTGLPNRELLLDRLGVAMTRARTEQAVRPTMMMIDIDKFRSVNQSLGLVIGDSLLLTIARRMQRHLSPGDTLSRIGGDQFAILMTAEQDPRELAALAERVRRSLRSPIKIAGQEIVLTGAIGIAVYDGEEQEPADLLKEAEMAMFRAKRSGADKIEIFRPEMRSERDDRVTIESDLRRAIERKELKVLYQPIVYLPTEELAGFEALVRWEHPKNGMMNPAAFVPVAEESDLIVKLGSFVLLKAALECQKWQKELPREISPLFVSVNVSSRQLFRQDLIQEIRHILGRNMVQKGSLKLEVTESLVMENPEQATEILELLRGAGAEMALDDFGTGYSSLAYLQRFPFDTIKIDRALVQSSGVGDNAGSTIVRSMVALAHELGKKVVAEGVEEAEDVGFLRSIGCEYAQGFYYGEPMTERDALQLIRMVKKSEKKMKPRGLFRAKSKSKRRKTRDEAAAAAAAAQPSDAMPVNGLNGANGANGASGDQGAANGAQAAGPMPPRVVEGPAPAGGDEMAGAAGRSPAGLPRATVRPRGHRAPPPVPPMPPTQPMPPAQPMPPVQMNGAYPHPDANGAPQPSALDAPPYVPPPFGVAAPPPLPQAPPPQQSVVAPPGMMAAPPVPPTRPPASPPPYAGDAVNTAARNGAVGATPLLSSEPYVPPPMPQLGMPPLPNGAAHPNGSLPPNGGAATGYTPPSQAAPGARTGDPRTGPTTAPTGELSRLSPGLAASLARIAGTEPPGSRRPPPPQPPTSVPPPVPGKRSTGS